MKSWGGEIPPPSERVFKIPLYKGLILQAKLAANKMIRTCMLNSYASSQMHKLTKLRKLKSESCRTASEQRWLAGGRNYLSDQKRFKEEIGIIQFCLTVSLPISSLKNLHWYYFHLSGLKSLSIP